MSKNALIVVTNYKDKSFNHAMADQAKKTLEGEGYTVKISDLYKKKFNPVASMDNFLKVKNPKEFNLVKEMHNRENLGKDVQEEQKLVDWANLIVIQTPLWWFGLPAILKGWFDRILTGGWAYGFNMWYKKGPMKDKKILFSFSTGGGPNMYADNAVNGDIERILFPIEHGIAYFCGFQVQQSYVAWSVEYVDETARKEYLIAFDHHLKNMKKKEFKWGAK